MVSGVFALSFSGLASSAHADPSGRVMTFTYVPTNVGFAVGPALGSVVTRASFFAIFPVAAALHRLWGSSR